MNMDSSSNPSSPDSERGTCCHQEDSFDSKRWNMGDRSKRIRASARERRRRHVLNSALENLRQRVPCTHQNPQKLSKIEVLRMAIDYISMLSCYLETSSSPYFGFDPREKEEPSPLYHRYPVKAPGMYSSPEDSLQQQLTYLNDSDGSHFMPPDLEAFFQQVAYQNTTRSYLYQEGEMYTS